MKNKLTLISYKPKMEFRKDCIIAKLPEGWILKKNKTYLMGSNGVYGIFKEHK